ncbi:hypothetical protein GTY54_35120 [Streptomyces sp. SID625]|nr:hypothetical protein [Streptomyces sp. SID625]
MAERDPGGCFRVLDRCKDLIDSGGHHIFPTEVENVPTRHPAVLSTAVVGVAHHDLGEAPGPVWSRRRGAPPTPGRCCGTAARAWRTTRCRAVVFRDDLPVTGSGKLRRNRLRGTEPPGPPSGSYPARDAYEGASTVVTRTGTRARRHGAPRRRRFHSFGQRAGPSAPGRAGRHILPVMPYSRRNPASRTTPAPEEPRPPAPPLRVGVLDAAFLSLGRHHSPGAAGDRDPRPDEGHAPAAARARGTRPRARRVRSRAPAAPRTGPVLRCGARAGTTTARLTSAYTSARRGAADRRRSRTWPGGR